ncbi:fasciclin domain-containing protein [Tepidiforma sp.]|uniref:fasciclin domain-containing protein n=1 Tax=Tepidiforma sp. TaxID=2682230 RepID=UPI002ADD60FD|nr:fasciclin domain-containing protein [Tepidiforma sp.]
MRFVRMRGAVLLAAAGIAAIGMACGGDDEEEEASPIPTAPAATADIVDTAVAAGNFTTLAKALEEAGLVQTLKGEGPFTVFAPTDEAFAALPAGTLDSLLANKDELTKVLTYHVVAGRVTSDQVSTMTEATTVEGSKLMIRVENGQARINDATVVTADVQATNGVIHVIDRVLIPE